MARSFFGYVRAAFNARYLGMPIPLNWIGVVGVALAGWLDPGFIVIGAGIELAYLLLAASSKRFQRFIDGSAAHTRNEENRLRMLLLRLTPVDATRYNHLQSRCRELLLEQQSHGADISAQNDALSRLLLVYLQLLVTQQNLEQLLRESPDADDLPQRIDQLQKQLQTPDLPSELRNSLEGQLQILQQRLASRQEATNKYQFVNAELVRIQEQVELVREQSALISDPANLTERVDAIAGSLTQTGQWVREQQTILGRMDDLTAEPPPILETGQAQKQ
jgi:hypothetical protein